MRIIKNKKGFPVFMAVAVFFAFAALLMLWSALLAKQQINKGLGSEQFMLFETYQQGEQTMFFIDQSARYAAYQTIHELANNGGYEQHSDCGKYNEYVLWDYMDKECFPTTEGVNNNFTFVFDQRFGEYLESILPEDEEDTLIEYELELIQNENLTIIGFPSRAINLIKAIHYEDLQMVVGEVVGYEPEDGSGRPPGRGSPRPGIPVDSSCGETIASIAEMGIGHPYCFASVEWDPKNEPPTQGSCQPPYPNPYCSYSDWNRKVLQTGKCTIDCSAFTKWVYNRYEYLTQDSDFHIDLRTAYWQAINMGKVVDHNPMKDWNRWWNIYPNCNNLQKGDLVFFSQTYGELKVSHVGIYVGECKIIHAGNPVQELKLDSTWAKKHYIGAKRVCPDVTMPTGSVVGIDAIETSQMEIDQQYLNKSCVDLNGTICLENESCNGYTIVSNDTERCCLQGECEWIFAAREISIELLPEEQKRLLNLSRDEVIKPELEERDSKTIVEPKWRDYTWIFLGIGILVVLILLVYIIRKKKLISVSYHE